MRLAADGDESGLAAVLRAGHHCADRRADLVQFDVAVAPAGDGPTPPMTAKMVNIAIDLHHPSGDEFDPVRIFVGQRRQVDHMTLLAFRRSRKRFGRFGGGAGAQAETENERGEQRTTGKSGKHGVGWVDENGQCTRAESGGQMRGWSRDREVPRLTKKPPKRVK